MALNQHWSKIEKYVAIFVLFAIYFILYDIILLRMKQFSV
jgi:hypothetical protein